MNNNPHDDWEELFGQLLADTAANDEHRERLRIQFLKACEDGPAPSSQRSEIREIGRFLMKYKAPHWTVATLLVACVVWLSQSTTTQVFALDEVVANLVKARTARYDMTVTVAGQPTMKAKAYFLAPSHFRQEMDNGYVNIADWKTRRMVGLDSMNKVATVITMVNLPADPDGERQKNQFEMIRDRLQQAVGGQEAKVESLGEKQLDGRTVVGFRLATRPVPMTVWADPKTKFPIRIDAVMIGPPRTEVVMTNYEFDIKLDKSKFSTEVPDGYTVTKTEIDVSTPTEKDFIAALRICGKATGGFLKGVDPVAVAAFSGAYMAKQGITKDKSPTVEQMQQIVKVSRGFQFAMSLSPETDAHYAGADAKPGDSARAVFWYQPEKSKKYRVVYADFSVKELAAAPQIEGAIKITP
jgi:outer membrane lipoprotein-sorting protein